MSRVYMTTTYLDAYGCVLVWIQGGWPHNYIPMGVANALCLRAAGVFLFLHSFFCFPNVRSCWSVGWQPAKEREGEGEEGVINVYMSRSSIPMRGSWPGTKTREQ